MSFHYRVRGTEVVCDKILSCMNFLKWNEREIKKSQIHTKLFVYPNGFTKDEKQTKKVVSILWVLEICFCLEIHIKIVSYRICGNKMKWNINATLNVRSIVWTPELNFYNTHILCWKEIQRYLCKVHRASGRKGNTKIQYILSHGLLHTATI